MKAFLLTNDVEKPHLCIGEELPDQALSLQFKLTVQAYSWTTVDSQREFFK